MSTTPRLTVAIDLDGTLTAGEWSGPHEIPDPLPGAVAFVNAVYSWARVVIHSCRLTEGALADGEFFRAAERRDQVVAWLERHGFAYDDCWVDRGKPHADAYLDDKAVRADVPFPDLMKRLRAALSMQG